jgi:hypothetical protein
MTDWRDIVKMVEAFSEVLHIRHCPDKTDITYPPVPTAINPPQSKGPPIDPPSRYSAQVNDRIKESSAGYTGELGSSRGDDQSGLNPDSASLQWRNVWPE